MTRPCPLQPSPIFCHVISSTRVPPMFGEPIFKNGIILAQIESKWPKNGQNGPSATQTTHVPHSSGHKHWSLLASSTHTLISIMIWNRKYCLSKVTKCHSTEDHVKMWCPSQSSNWCPGPKLKCNPKYIFWLKLWNYSIFGFISWYESKCTLRTRGHFHVTFIRSSHFWFRIILLMFIYDPS